MNQSFEPTLQSRSDEQHFFATIEDAKQIIDRFCAGELGEKYAEEVWFDAVVTEAAMGRAVSLILQHPALETAQHASFNIHQQSPTSLLLMLETVVDDDAL